MEEQKVECPKCKGTVTFTQRYSTMPQDAENMVRRYEDVICAMCGTPVSHTYVDEKQT